MFVRGHKKLPKWSPLRILIFSLVIIFSICGCSESKNQQQIPDVKSTPDSVHPETVEPEKAEQFDSALVASLTKLVDSASFSGVVNITSKDGKVFERTYGYSNFEEGIKNSDSTFFQIASLTKIFTAIGVYDLVNKGKMKYTDPFTKHLKSKLPYKNVQIKHLLNHTSGIPDYFSLAEKYFKGPAGPDNREIFGLYSANSVKLKFAPGSSFEYSNINYIILSSIIEDVSGMPFERYLRESVSGVPDHPSVYSKNELKDSFKQVAIAYASTGKKYQKVSAGATRILDNRKGSGGLYIRAGQLHDWLCRLFFKNDYYSGALHNAGLNKSLDSRNYIFGFYKGKIAENEYLYCYGKNPGMNSFCAYLPKQEIIITISGNHEFNSQNTGEKFVSTIISAKKK